MSAKGFHGTCLASLCFSSHFALLSRVFFCSCQRRERSRKHVWPMKTKGHPQNLIPAWRHPRRQRHLTMTLGTKRVTHALGNTRLALISATTFYGRSSRDATALMTRPLDPRCRRAHCSGAANEHSRSCEFRYNEDWDRRGMGTKRPRTETYPIPFFMSGLEVTDWQFFYFTMMQIKGNGGNGFEEFQHFKINTDKRMAEDHKYITKKEICAA